MLKTTQAIQNRQGRRARTMKRKKTWKTDNKMAHWELTKNFIKHDSGQVTLNLMFHLVLATTLGRQASSSV